MSEESKVGMAHPKCKGCGHNYFDMPKRPVRPDGSAADGGLCQWCVQELTDEARDNDRDWLLV